MGAALLFGASVVAAPGEARADVYIPLATDLSRATVPLFVVVVLLEAFVVWRMLATSLGASLITALIANAATTLVGVALALHLKVPKEDFHDIATLFMVSVVIEAEIVRRRHAAPWHRAWAAAIVMNILSYAVLIATSHYLKHRWQEWEHAPKGPPIEYIMERNRPAARHLRGRSIADQDYAADRHGDGTFCRIDRSRPLAYRD